MTITLDTKVVAARHQVSCEVGGEVVILSMSDELYYGLDPVGARVWTLVREPRTVRAIRDALVAEFEVDARTCQEDLVTLLTEMQERNLIRTDGPAA